MPSKILPQAALKELFDYDPITGVLVWRNRPLGHFKNSQSFASWNTKYAGKEAGCLDAEGYFVVGINGNLFKAHRIIYKIIHGTEPLQIDHKNHIRHDNWQDNLRAANNKINMQNRKLPFNSTSGIMGVFWNKNARKWMAHITADGKRIPIGRFEDLFEAICARKSSEVKHGFHENHGRQS